MPEIVRPEPNGAAPSVHSRFGFLLHVPANWSSFRRLQLPEFAQQNANGRTAGVPTREDLMHSHEVPLAVFVPQDQAPVNLINRSLPSRAFREVCKSQLKESSVRQ